MTPTAIYRSIMLECERRRHALELPMDKFSEYAGLPERYYSKALHADESSGRQAQWTTLQLIIDALFPGGFDLIIKAKPGPAIDANNLKAKLLQLKALKEPLSQRTLMAELGRAGGKSSGESRRLKSQQRRQRATLASHASRIRWATQNTVKSKQKPWKECVE